jgi:hypothetical protein
VKKIQIIGFTIIVMLAICSAAVSVASALEFLISGVAVKAGEKVSVSMSGALILEDMNKGSPMALECVGTGTGVVEAAGKGVQETATATSCVTLAGTCASPSMKAIHLPWTTQIEGERNLISSSGAGAPGYEVTCFGIIHDTCEGTTSVGLENMPTETPPDLLAIFSATLSEPGKCTIGGANEGLIIGEVLVTTTEGLSLAVTTTERLSLAVS